MKSFENIRDFMRFINNYFGESIIRKSGIFDKKTNEKIAEYKK